MEDFAPLLLLLFFWVFIGIPVSIAKKAANQKRNSMPAARKAPETEQKPAIPQAAKPERLTTLTSSLTEPDHDDSVYTGSLGAFSTEGYDPCHDEQMSDLEKVCEPGREIDLPQEKARLPFGWTGSDMVRGIVMSEILNRKH